MKNIKDKHVLVTGAGSGIGRATAIAFAQEGAKLWLVDINELGNKETADTIRESGGEVSVHYCDVTDAEAMNELANTIHQQIDHIDILVNNAGIGAAGRFIDTQLESWQKVLSVNVMGVVHGCHAFLPRMVEAAKRNRKQAGHVINLSSLAGYFAPPDLSIYSTSKFAVFGFSESLRADMAKYGIGVSTICPGIVYTPIVENALAEGEMAEKPESLDKMVAFYKKRNFLPHRVAEQIVKAVKRNKGVCPVTLESHFMYFMKRLIPGIVGRVSRIDNPIV
ncbi:SDR family NAD(P)-dependent oxidoreductase [Veronia pacifica]|uniref:Ketoreductase domain-containing protein n=1 Tax=Veronia pacifica TaxID=1080227 RepID=A0A1C3EQ43_9GAMM|nr:SDR family NAD(P)-dependent oxidoreductase [Veronia pacifica]ODA35354.1 hypothetical protein A8L45_04100 [Veronia pacifica]